MYLESVALLPQLYMFQKQATDEGGIVEVRSSSLYPSSSTHFSIRISQVTWYSPWASRVYLNLPFG